MDLNFTVHAVRGGEIGPLRFCDLVTRRVIVSVHMRNNTPSCDRQLASLAAAAADFERAGYDLIALSRDSAAAHKKYAAAKGIGFTLVSDPRDAFARAARSMVEKSMYGRTFEGPARAAFVIERDGRVLAVLEKVDSRQHAHQLLALIKSL